MRTFTLSICLVGTLWANRADARHGLFKHKSVSAGPVVSTAPTAGCIACEAAQAGGAGLSVASGSAATTGGGPGQPPIRPYSYYAAVPGQARGYYGYGQDQFPYYGRAYGHPYDPWTWAYMSGYHQNSLNRYYEPVLK